MRGQGAGAGGDVRSRSGGDRGGDHLPHPGRRRQHAKQSDRQGLRTGNAARAGRDPGVASTRYGQPIYLLSDEPYNRIVFDGIEFHSPAEFYAHTLVAYSYGKTLLAPGQRIGYLALSPRIPEVEREQLREDVFTAQLANAYAFPNAVLQRALPELEMLTFDTARLQRKRDRLVSALREIGYSVHVPEGTFYLFPQSPIPDDWAFVEMLEARDLFCHPGSISEWPGYFRICLTATEEMIEAAIPRFAEVFAAVEERL